MTLELDGTIIQSSSSSTFGQWMEKRYSMKRFIVNDMYSLYYDIRAKYVPLRLDAYERNLLRL